jgi:AcrR family transcriptional regulator
MSAEDMSRESETRERLLAQAEKMFAARGYDGTSVRQITQEAGANVAAVSYYFGGKQGLYEAVFERVLVEMRERRIHRIKSDLDEAGNEGTLEAFLGSFAAAFVEPLVEGERGKDFMSLFDQEMRLHKMPTKAFFEQLIEPMLALFAESLERVGVGIDRSTAAMCLMSLVGQLSHALKASRRLEGGARQADVSLALDDSIAHIVKFSAAGIRACAAAGSEEGKDVMKP